mgnify:CR=1 FL=1
MYEPLKPELIRLEMPGKKADFMGKWLLPALVNGK